MSYTVHMANVLFCPYRRDCLEIKVEDAYFQSNTLREKNYNYYIIKIKCECRGSPRRFTEQKNMA